MLTSFSDGGADADLPQVLLGRACKFASADPDRRMAAVRCCHCRHLAIGISSLEPKGSWPR